MTKKHLVSQPTRVDELSWEDLMDDFRVSDVAGKAEREHVRRMRQIKRQKI
jgi:hypothetical protein